MKAKASLEERIAEKLRMVDALAQEMPGVVIVHNMTNLSIVYMSQRGLDELGVTLEELQSMGPEYYDKFFNSEETKEQVPKMIGLLERNDDKELVALFQQVRRSEKHPWKWHCTSLKILMRDDDGKPLLTIAIAIPIDPDHHLTNKVNRLLEENNFLRQHFHLFDKLSRREKEALKHLALGFTSGEVAAKMNIATLTVDSYRKNIKEKLDIKTVYEMAQYARAFDLI